MKDGGNPQLNMITTTVVPKAEETTETVFIFTFQITGGFNAQMVV